MARQTGEFLENQFIKGLITEATGLNFPEKAVTESWNVRYDKAGEVSRRFGIDNETAAVDSAAVFASGVRRSFIWKNAGLSRRSFTVVQTGSLISFFRIPASGNLTPNLESFQINLGSYDIDASYTEIRQYPCGFASGKGHLFITHPLCSPLWVDYDATDNTITVTDYDIMIRDFKGVDDNLDTDETPTTLSNKHKYNLYNQGWYPQVGEVEFGSSNTYTYNVIDYTFAVMGSYPANSEQWWVYKDEDEAYNPTRRKNFPLTSTEAPKGHYIYNAFDIDRVGMSGISNIPGYTTTKRPGAVAFYAGRVWYCGVGDDVYYTQVIETDKQYGLCYQKNDPTSENLSDLLDTDGGVIQILGMGTGTALFTEGSNLFVFTDNGIWIISGSGAEGTGFVATDFSVRRISTVPLKTIDSLIDVEGTPIWWNLEGIWALQKTQGGGVDVVSLSHDTIKTFLSDDCPVGNRPYVQGAFNPSERTVQWLYRSTAAEDTNDYYRYDRILEMNMATGALYPMKWNGDVVFGTIIPVGNISVETVVDDVVTNNSEETLYLSDGTTEITIDELEMVEFTSSKFKYLNVVDNDTFNIMEEKDTRYADFASTDEQDYSSYFISGASVMSNGHVGTLEYITVYAATINNGSAFLQIRWDWSNSGLSAKWSSTQQCYTVNRDYRDVSRKKLLARGSGPAIQLKFSSETGKPFKLIGWSGYVSVDAKP